MSVVNHLDSSNIYKKSAKLVKIRLELILSVCFHIANGQCNIPSPFASSTWLDSTRGTITFDTTTMNGWGVTVFHQQRSSWECVDSSDSSTLVLK
jgi:hypothetical protein